MDMKRLCDALINHDELKDIPVIYILKVAFAVFSIINSGEYFLNNEGDVYGMENV